MYRDMCVLLLRFSRATSLSFLGNVVRQEKRGKGKRDKKVSDSGCRLDAKQGHSRCDWQQSSPLGKEQS